MRDIVSKSRVLVVWGLVLVVLHASTAFADRPDDSRSRSRDERLAERMEFLNRPAVSGARSIVKHGGDLLEMLKHGKKAAQESETLRRAERIMRQWDNGELDPEPVLLTVRLSTREFSKTSGELEVIVLDEDGDLLGIRIRETYRLPNGVESVFEEDYPVYVDLGGLSLGDRRFLVRYRTGLQVKDASRWRRLVQHVQAVPKSSAKRAPAGLESELTKPPVWIATPEPNRVEVSVSVYDRAGHESESVPVDWLFEDEDDTSARKSLDYATYERHREKIARWPDSEAAPRPGNAALLYYRAAGCLTIPDPCTARIIGAMHRGGEPDDRVRAHLGRCVKGIQLAHLASQIPECDWGLDQDFESRYTMETIASLRRLSFALADYAQTLAADGHCRVALENCLVNRRFARHIGDSTHMLYLVSHSVNVKAVFPILRILGDMPSDVQTLRWLRDQLVIVKGPPSRPAEAFSRWCDLEVQALRRFAGDRSFERSWAVNLIENEKTRKKATALTDEQLYIYLLREQRAWPKRSYGLAMPDELLVRARQAYGAFVDSAVDIVESDASHRQKQTELDELEDELRRRMKQYEPVALLGEGFTDVQAYHKFLVREEAFLSCARVAVEVLLLSAETGRVPLALPKGLPKDPWTGKDFVFERTDEDFLLRVDPDCVSEFRGREFRFKAGRP